MHFELIGVYREAQSQESIEGWILGDSTEFGLGEAGSDCCGAHCCSFFGFWRDESATLEAFEHSPPSFF